VLKKLGMAPRDLLRKREKEYKELGLAETSLTDEDLIEAMAKHPRLIERPIAMAGRKAVMGRPTEAVLELL
jgi:arsenate reductase